MILVFLGSVRATSAVFLSIPLSALATFVVLYMMGSTINTMILGGLALAFSRIIDNSVISLENIYRHLEKGEPARRSGTRRVGSEPGGIGGNADDGRGFFPGRFLYGVSKFLFSALALALSISLLHVVVAMTVIPLFCARYLKADPHSAEHTHVELKSTHRAADRTMVAQVYSGL